MEESNSESDSNCRLDPWDRANEMLTARERREWNQLVAHARGSFLHSRLWFMPLIFCYMTWLFFITDDIVDKTTQQVVNFLISGGMFAIAYMVTRINALSRVIDRQKLYEQRQLNERPAA